MHGSLSNWLILTGLVLVTLGLVVKTGILGWFGQLPGDIRIERENSSFYFPLSSMILISVVLSLIINLIRRYFS